MKMADHPFVTFSGEHFLGLGLSLGCGVALVWAAWRARGRWVSQAVRWGLAGGCVASAVFLVLWWAWAGAPLKYLLPLHLCDLSGLIAPIALTTGNRLLYELLYFWGIGGATQGLLTPNVSVGFPSIRCVCCFQYHALIVTSALYATVVMRMRPTGGSLLRAWLLANAYAGVLIPLNLALGTNYMFLLRKPPTPSLLDLMGPWPWYLVVGDVVALLVMGLCYLPFFALDLRRHRRLSKP